MHTWPSISHLERVAHPPFRPVLVLQSRVPYPSQARKMGQPQRRFIDEKQNQKGGAPG